MDTRTPQDVLSDRKIAILLDDLLQDCLDAIGTAKGLRRRAIGKVMGSATAKRFEGCMDAVLRSSGAVEAERDRCLAGKASNLKAMRGLVQAQLDALDNLEEFNGRVQVLEDAMMTASLADFMALIVMVQGVSMALVRLQRRLEALRDKLAKAIRNIRDAKIKAMVGAAIAAIGVCIVPMGPVVVFIGGMTLVGADIAVDMALQGSEESKLKKNWAKRS